MNCQWCSNQINTSIIRMPDGYTVCSHCQIAVENYYKCKQCGDKLSAQIGSRAREKLERTTCKSEKCRKSEEIATGQICCDKAVCIPCVCTRSYKCPDHAPDGIHVGTHD